MTRHCSAFGCTNTSWKESCKKKGISFHFFPKDELLLQRWLINIRRTNFKPSRSSLLCSEHFTDDNFVYQPFTNRRQLKKDAIPTQFSFTKEEKWKAVTEETSNNYLSHEKGENEIHDSSSDSEFTDSDISLNEMEKNNSTLLDASMNEKFYSPEQLETFTNSLSKYSSLSPKCYDILKKKALLKKKLKAKIFLKALKKQWLDAEIKAAAAKRDYYETKKLMLTKLKKDVDLENNSDFETNTALQNIKSHLKKEELASQIEKRMLKQQLEDAKIAANFCEKDYLKAEREISNSDDI
ncbi:THAP domain-containing protein 3-like [Argiope bruennichi]|uniref:THAP domain-containing protein 3-like n=1 Tax=Argiope bruennichi TaxID=94029 RepID=UPI00249594E0|nr:THAP domain-containing protein 3-like [Argiope bruennichi]